MCKDSGVAKSKLDAEKVGDNYAESLLLQAWLSTPTFLLLLPKRLHTAWNCKAGTKSAFPTRHSTAGLASKKQRNGGGVGIEIKYSG